MTSPPQRPSLAIVADGLRRVASAPAVVLGLWVVTALVALRPSVSLGRAIAGDLGSSMAASSAAAGVNASWWQEFMERQPAFADTFQPFIIGFGAVVANVSAFLGAKPPGPVFAAAAVAYALAWIFLLGGILDRYARQRRTGAHGFFAVSGVFFFRFLRLAVIAGAVWAVLFALLHRWLFELQRWLTRDTTVERTAFAWHVALTLVFGLAVAAVMLVFDYAKVRAVVEDRRSMVGAVLSGVRFVRRNLAAAASVFLLNVVLFGFVLAAYALLARGASGGDTLTWILGLAVAQLYVAARLVVKLSFYASAVSLFQNRLAHAQYTAAPPAVWPESPEVETIAERRVELDE